METEPWTLLKLNWNQISCIISYLPSALAGDPGWLHLSIEVILSSLLLLSPVGL